MFIYNFKVNGNFLIKLFFSIAILFVIILCIISTYKIFSTSFNNEEIKSEDYIPSPEVAVLTEENYTTILEAVHKDMTDYIGQKISFTGFVYRLPSLKENQFVLARKMLINEENQYVVVGFLCYSDQASKFADGDWINIVGIIEKGDYFGEIPILNISEIKSTEKPSIEFVSPPDDFYVPTAIIY